MYTIINNQKSVALSSSDAEYLALSDACELVAWLRQGMLELISPQDPTSVKQKNNGCKDWA